MSALQQQIIDLNNKVDQLHRIVERLSEQISSLTTHHETSPTIEENKAIELNIIEPMISSESLNDTYYSSVMEHKDIINDQDSSSKLSHQSSYYSETYLPPEIQIRRLTAQLTAAYNRIAVLEEQLLARRIHH
ncbi:conserved hypothetical protein [Gloeothece citriformis PCC 7424]|uniref:Uncharacterized protein n=1 Tax=Gloeothece citriformis (strain PCC 7424) TaxID=65393 RepID=B7KEY7_GLOC7|nr:hypothetical protein [Gloeothece citriformis]ACK70443.1 conserved hypothetical protein [Gloeothece citriformis PCC 7424]